jgi:hypothetical protein
MLGLMDMITYAEDGATYETLYLASSLTHGRTNDGTCASGLPPSLEAASIWRRLSAGVKLAGPQKLYISRRSWIHGNTSNIGTNYTTRRQCINEDEVVALFERHGYKETFCELMTMEEKIAAFSAATHVAGFIGGGMANLLFSPPQTRATCIETPEFLRINERFRHSMDHTQITYLPVTSLAPHEGPWPLYVRVLIKVSGLIGEIAGWVDGKYSVKVSNNDVAGFELDANFKEGCYAPDELEPLDGGLNSPFVCDLNVLEKYLSEE